MTEKGTLIGHSNPALKDCQNLANISSSVEDLFTLLESSSKPSVVHEIKQLINEQYSEVKEPWLVYGLYDTFCSTKSPKCLELLLDVRKEPHDHFLCDRLCDALRHSGKQRSSGLEVLGYIVRKQPSWLYKITEHSLMKQWIKVLKTEDDIVMMLNGVFNLIAFLPSVAGKMAKFLEEIFGIFGRLASWRFQCLHLPEVQQMHLEVTLYAFFHRLFGMYPCNFLSYLRQSFGSQGSKEAQALFLGVIRPIMNTVRMHPLLVTNTREYERHQERWKSMAVHDIIVESARISLLSQESTNEETLNTGDMMDIHDVPPKSPFISFPFTGIPGIEKHQNINSTIINVTTVSTTSTTTISLGGPVVDKTIDRNIRQNLLNSRAVGGNMTPPGNAAIANSIVRKTITPSRLTILESPPEPAIEATPETTPFVTPVRDDAFRPTRVPPSNTVARQLNLDCISSSRSPIQKTRNSFSATLENPSHVGSLKVNSVTGQTSTLGSCKQESTYLSATTPTSPQKDVSPFRFPELPQHFPGNISANQLFLNNERRDSLFERTDQLVTRMAMQSSIRHDSVENATTVPSGMTYDSNAPTISTISTPSTSHTLTDGRETEICEDRDKLREDANSTQDSIAVSSCELLKNVSIQSMVHQDQITSVHEAERIGNVEHLSNMQQNDITSLAQYRPSPVKFTNQRPEQFPVKPKPERIPPVSKTYETKNCNLATSVETENPKSQTSESQRPMLSLETMKDFTDFGKEEDDDEVKKLTGMGDNQSQTDLAYRQSHDFTTRHITPQICVSAGGKSTCSSTATSRTTSRLSGASSIQIDKSRPATASGSEVLPVASSSTNVLQIQPMLKNKAHLMQKMASDSSEDQLKFENTNSSGTIDAAESTSERTYSNMNNPAINDVTRVNNFVQQVRGRMRYISLCASSEDVTPEVASILAKFPATSSTAAAIRNYYSKSDDDNGLQRQRSKYNSCPDLRQATSFTVHQFQQIAAVANAMKSSGHNTVTSTLINKDGTPNSENVHKDKSGIPNEPRKTVQHNDKHDIHKELEKEVQTEAFIVYPYEHLFSDVWPQQMSNNKQIKNGHDDSKVGLNNQDTYKNPYDILDDYIQHICDKIKYSKLANNQKLYKQEYETSVLKAEVGLLHNQVLYERHRRETLGIRNRRLLSKTKSNRMLEEKSTALNDQLIRRDSEITKLRDQLELVRREKHEVEEERAENAKQRDKEIEKLVLENDKLKQSNLELEDQVSRQEKELRNASSEINKLHSALFNSKSEADLLRAKAEGKMKAEAELVNLRKEVLLLGEMQRRYREKMPTQRFGEYEQERLYRVAYENQIAQMESALSSAKSEMEVAKGKAQELESLVTKKDHVIAAQKVLHDKILEEYEAKKPEAEEAYNSLLVQNLQLEQRILELNDQVDRSVCGVRQRLGNHGTGHQRVTSSGSLSSQSNRSLLASPTSPGYGEIPGSMSGVFLGPGRLKTSRVTSVTANVDMPPPRELNVALIEEKSSFIIGSPPSSSDGGSIGSDHSALIQRALESGGPINLETGPSTYRHQGARRQSQAGNSERRVEHSESEVTLMTHRSGSSNGSLQPASPETLVAVNTVDSMQPSSSGVSLREGSGNSAGSSINGHTHSNEEINQNP